MKTKAAILWELNRPLVIDEVEVPDLKPGQVLVKILFSGVCRAQYNEMIGLKGPDKFLPHLLGHEGTGIIKETGPKVKKVKKGDFVALSWIKGNGMEVPSSLYKSGNRIINAGAITTFSDYSVVSENRITKISKKIPADKAAVIGCAVATGCGIINHTLKVSKGSSLAVFGIGGIGASAVMGARLAGCARIIAVDVSSQKLGFAKKLGATHAFTMNEPGLLQKISTLTEGGVDFAIDASGAKSAMELAFDSLKYPGTAVIAGNLSKDEKISLHPFELIKGKRLIGTWGGETQPDSDFPRYVQSYLSGNLPLDSLITHRFKLTQINQAFEVLNNGRAGRVLINMQA